MLMTAAGTVAPAHLLVIGAGVAGLQAIATARRLGAVVTACDVRPAAKERSRASALARSTLARGRWNRRRRRGTHSRNLGSSTSASACCSRIMSPADVVITTAQIRGRRAPKLVSGRAVERMRPGSVVVDLAADGGGNCELTEPGSTLVRHGVTIAAPENLPAEIAGTASHHYARDVASFVLELIEARAPDAELVCGTINVVGGFLTTGRMLRMFRKQPGGSR